VDTGTVNLVGVHWSSTEMSGDPLSYAWVQYFATAGGSLQLVAIKSMAPSVRCSRALSP